MSKVIAKLMLIGPHDGLVPQRWSQGMNLSASMMQFKVASPEQVQRIMRLPAVLLATGLTRSAVYPLMAKAQLTFLPNRKPAAMERLCFVSCSFRPDGLYWF